MFSLTCAWANGNNREAGDLRRHRAHYDVNAMNHTLPHPWGLATVRQRKWTQDAVNTRFTKNSITHRFCCLVLLIMLQMLLRAVAHEGLSRGHNRGLDAQGLVPSYFYSDIQFLFCSTKYHRSILHLWSVEYRITESVNKWLITLTL